MNQSIAQLIGQMLQAAPAAPGKAKTMGRPLAVDASQSGDGFDAILGKTLRPGSAGSKIATALAEGGQPDQAVALADGPADGAVATESSDPSGSSKIALVVQAMLGLNDAAAAAQGQGKSIKLPSKIDPEDPAQVAQLVKRILSRSAQAGASVAAQLDQVSQSGQADGAQTQGSNATDREAASPAAKLAKLVSDLSADAATGTANPPTGDVLELLNLARKAVLEANRQAESLPAAASAAANTGGSRQAGTSGTTTMNGTKAENTGGQAASGTQTMRFTETMNGMQAEDTGGQAASGTQTNESDADVAPVADGLAAGLITNGLVRSGPPMRVVEFQVADPTGAVADPLIAAASDVVKLPAGSGAMVHDDAIIPTVGSQLTTHAASVSVAVASEADLQATSGEEASGRHGSAATWQMRWSRQAIESGDATAASLGTRSVTGRVGGASWLSSGLVTPAAREVHAAIATPAAAAAADSSATVAPADSMTPWAQAFAAATTSTNDLLGSAGTALVGMDSLSATPAKWGTVSQAGLSGTELAGLAGVSGVAESAGLQGALAQGDGSAGSAASNDGSFDADVNADRIMRAMTTQLNGRAGGSIRLRLDPPGLGELRIDMSLTGDGVKVTLMPSNEASAQLLGGQLHQLREALQSRGFSIASLNVDHPQGVDSTGRGGQDRAADQFNGQQQGQQGGQGSQNQGRHQPSDSQSQGVQDNGTAPNAEAGGRGRGTALNAEAMVGGPRVSNLPEREREELNLIG